jgi:hypothetical protein
MGVRRGEGRGKTSEERMKRRKISKNPSSFSLFPLSPPPHLHTHVSSLPHLSLFKLISTLSCLCPPQDSGR